MSVLVAPAIDRGRRSPMQHDAAPGEQQRKRKG